MYYVAGLGESTFLKPSPKGWAVPTLFPVNQLAHLNRRNNWLQSAASGGPEAPGLDAVLLDLVAQDPETGVQQVRRLALVAPGLTQGLGDQLFFQFLHLGGQAAGGGGAGLLTLQRRRQVHAEDGVLIADQHGPLDDVLQFPDVAGPGILHQQVQGRSRQAFHRILVFRGILAEKMVRQ